MTFTINLDAINGLLCLVMIIFCAMSVGHGFSTTRKFRRPKVKKIIDTNTILVDGDVSSLSRDFNQLTNPATFVHLGAYKWKIVMPALEYADDTMTIANTIDGAENWTWKNAEWVSPQARAKASKRLDNQIMRAFENLFGRVSK